MKFKYAKLSSQPLFEKQQIGELPLIIVQFEKFDYCCLVDSGATDSYMHADMGRELGLKIEEGSVLSCNGITGTTFRSYLHRINIE